MSKKLQPQKVYLASPFFNDEQNAVLDDVEKLLDSFHVDYYSPRKKNKIEGDQFKDHELRRQTFKHNIDEIASCGIMLAIPMNKDMGTVFEAGVAYEQGKSIIYYAPFLKPDQPFNLMLAESGYYIVLNRDDLIKVLDSIFNNGTEQLAFDFDGNME